MPKTINMVKSFESQQRGTNLKPCIDLMAGDIVELKHDGMYFTRKINLLQEHDFKVTFDAIKKENEYKVRGVAHV